MALFFEDLHEGDRFTSAGRTITEADVVQFAMLSADWNPIHTNAAFSATTAYGQRVAHGILGIAVITGLMDRLGLFSGSAIAMLGVENWKFTAPIFIGDTVHFDLEITQMRLAKDGTRGIVGRHFTLKNQRGETVQEGDIPIMVRVRPPQ